MKNSHILFLLLFYTCNIFAQTGNVGIGTATPDASAILDVSSTTKGLLIPRVSIGNAATFGLTGATSTAGMMVYNTNASTTGGYGIGFYYWSGGVWNRIANGKIPATLSNGKIWIGDASNNPIEQTLSGDVTITNTGVATIQDNSVDGTDIALGSDTNGDLMYYNGTDWIRLASGTTGQILQTNGAAAPTWVNGTKNNKAQNGVNISTTTPNASATDAYIELGGTLVRPTTISGLTATNKMSFTGSGVDAFNIDGATFSIDATNDRVGMGTTTPARRLEVNNAMKFTNSSSDANDGVIGSATFSTGLNIVGINTDNTSRKINIWGGVTQNQNDLGNTFIGNTNFPNGIWNSSGNVGIRTTSIIHEANIGGRLYISNGVIQTGGTAITATSDLGLYSRTSGNYIRIVTNNAPVNFYSDDNAGTSINVSIAANGKLEAQKGFSTERQIRFYKRSRNNNAGGTDNLGNYDFCYLAGVAFRNTDSNIDEDDDYQCNVFTLDINASADGGEGANQDYTTNFTHSTRPYWKLYSECYADCSNSTCTAMCINFDY